VDILLIVYSSAELDRKTQRQWLYRLLQRFMSGGCQVYVLVAITTHKLQYN